MLSINSRLPPNRGFPSERAVSPLPATASKSVVSRTVTPFSFPYFITAFARGCSLLLSSVTATESRDDTSVPAQGTMSQTSGSPRVTVPVLSRTTVFTLPVCSSASAVLKRIPWRAPTPLPTIIATGVASPSAQGQLITRTDIALAREKPMSLPISSQTTSVTTAIEITTGTKTPETLSAIFAIGAFPAAASLTIFIICESVVSSPTRVASHLMKPERLTVAAETGDETSLSTGMLSPVSADSSTAL